MDFRFNVNKLLPKPINKITHTLIPEGFRGEDRREYNECQRLMTRIIDELGEASAKAQGLNRTITSAIKLRDTDHIVYLMVDQTANNGQGSVVGLLKTGSKTLFMFDENGLHYQLKPRCILDFYVHESRQRMGLGKQLYEHMLQEENLRPIKLAIDRPSEKFLAFLNKHYKLHTIIPQNNKFVVFQGFFNDEIDDSKTSRFSSPYKSEPVYLTNNNTNSHNKNGSTTPQSQQQQQQQLQNNTSVNGTSSARSAYGRFAAARPPCSMATIIHDTVPFGQANERSRSASRASNHHSDTLSLYSEDIRCDDSIKQEDDQEQDALINETEEVLKIEAEAQNEEPTSLTTEVSNPANNEEQTNENNSIIEECDNGKSMSPGSTQNDEKIGHLDLKFYHSPLW